MLKPNQEQDYSDIIVEILKILGKHQITYYGFEKIIQTISDEVKLFTFIDIDDKFRDEN